MVLKLTFIFGAALAAGGTGCGPGAYDLDGGDEVIVGQAFVNQRGCATCHQGAGADDGVLSGQTTPVTGTTAYGSNLTPDTATGLGGWADIEILRALRYGVDNQQHWLCPSMPRYDGSDGGAPLITDLEANAIIAYLRSLPPVKRATPESLCPPFKAPPDDLLVIPLDLRRPPVDAGPIDATAPDATALDGAAVADQSMGSDS